MEINSEEPWHPSQESPLNLEEFAGRLDKPKFKQKSFGRFYEARCPGHDDKSASFGVWEGADGWLHVKCQAGCSEDHILQSMGLTQEDRRTSNARPINHKGATEVKYIYTDQNGVYLFDKLRTGNGKDKKFIQRITKEDGSIEYGLVEALGDKSKTLYRISEVIAAVKMGKRIWVCEGEKAVEAFRGRKEIATCQPAGAGPGKWLAQHTAAFAGATEVIVVADRDANGEDYASEVAASLKSVASLVRVVQSKSTKEKDDAYDHFANDYSLDDFVERPDLLYGKPLEVERFDPDTFVDAEIDFLWEPYFPKGKLILLDADGGMGKTTFIIAACANLSRGILPANKGIASKPMNILYLHRGEDDSKEIATVFRRNGGDLNRLMAYSPHDLLFTPAGLQRVHSTILSHEIDLVIVDALLYFISPLVKSINAAEALVPIMEGMQAVARQTGVSWINVRHTRKGQIGELASEKGMGSVQFRNSHRGQLVMSYHPDELVYPGVVIVQDTKGSLLVAKGEPIGYKREAGQIVWVPLDEDPFTGKLTSSGTEALSAQSWLYETLKNSGPTAKAAIVATAEKVGHSKRTIERAATKIGVELRRPEMIWSLPRE